jgi:MOSC domain-containing protein YiiM
VAHLDSVNIGRARPNPYESASSTGIDKQPQGAPVWVRDPGPKTTGRGSGLVGDFVGDTKHHGGSDQAVYAFSREDLDDWENRLDRQLPNGFFGENLTIRELDVNSARIGERWRVGRLGRTNCDLSANPMFHVPRLGRGTPMVEDLHRYCPPRDLP